MYSIRCETGRYMDVVGSKCTTTSEALFCSDIRGGAIHPIEGIIAIVVILRTNEA